MALGQHYSRLGGTEATLGLGALGQRYSKLGEIHYPCLWGTETTLLSDFGHWGTLQWYLVHYITFASATLVPTFMCFGHYGCGRCVFGALKQAHCSLYVADEKGFTALEKM